jgi:hypothetical protein
MTIAQLPPASSFCPGFFFLTNFLCRASPFEKKRSREAQLVKKKISTVSA